MTRPFLNLSIVDLIEKFDAANGDAAVALELLKELRHRSTPKALALNRRVLEVLAMNASDRLFQSLLLPELEILCASFLDKKNVRSSVISALERRSSTKSRKLLDSLTIEEPRALKAAGAQESPPEKVRPTATVLVHTERSDFKALEVPSDVLQALQFFGLSDDSSWSDVEVARRVLVLKYRPGSGIAKEQAENSLEEISNSYLLLAKHMQARH